MAENQTTNYEQHWAKTRNLTIWILVIWAIAGILAPWFAEQLNSMTFLGFPLGYYMCVQGSLIIFVLLIVF